MTSKDPHFSGIRLTAPGGSIFGKLLAVATGTLLLVVAFMFSLLALGVLVIGGVLLFAYLKWKTRHLRRHLDEQLRAQMNRPAGEPEPTPEGRVIDGEVVGEPAYDARPASTSPPATDLPVRHDQLPDSGKA